MALPNIVILHYSAPPVIGGVEAVIEAHAAEMVNAGYPVTIVVGRGEATSMPSGVRLIKDPQIDSLHPEIAAMESILEQEALPAGFEGMVSSIEERLLPIIRMASRIIVHNVFTKHFNLPLTAALHRLIDAEPSRGWIAWCHDFSWTSPGSRLKMHPGYPWDLLREYRPEVRYVTVSKSRQKELASLLRRPDEDISVIYNGVSPQALLGLTGETLPIIDRLDLLDAEIILLMPVRITRAKNIEFALHVVDQLVTRGVHPKLLIVGPPDPHDPQSMEYFNALQALRDRSGLREYAHFIYELPGPNGDPTVLSNQGVGDLYRTADVLLIPSHREGFGIPVLEAGMVGARVFSMPIPAAEEIGLQDISLIDRDASPAQVAYAIMEWLRTDPTARYRSRVRRQYTWQAIFRRSIAPLL